MPTTVPSGEAAYKIGTAPCSGSGLRWSNEDLDDALRGRVATIIFDDEGTSTLAEVLSSVADTGFAQEALSQILSDADTFEDWRVGEGIAEAYLTDHRSCYFPWPVNRDVKKEGSSLPGADLVGFGSDDEGDCFAFGEVKTSSDSHYPPNTMYGPTGMKKQLEALRDKESIRNTLVMYLWRRAALVSWREQFKRAASRYLNNKTDVQLYGLLVRDVEPDERDIKGLINNLHDSRPEGMLIELIAIYLPGGSIEGIGEVLIATRTGHDE